MNFIKKLFSKKDEEAFEEIFSYWVNHSLQKAPLEKIKAFSFNLMEPAFEVNAKFGIELIGAGMFDENDEDWACEEVWEPQKRSLSIPISFSGDTWEKCLEIMSKEVKVILDSDQPSSEILNSKPVAIGFVDSNLTILRKPDRVSGTAERATNGSYNLKSK